MFLVVGLGNPGTIYQKTRHNVGFRVIEKIKELYSFPDFSLSQKEEALVSSANIGDEKVLLAMPQTLMNNSGRAVKRILDYSPCILKDLIVIHDDLDLSLAKMKITQDRGAAGHKGVKSIIQACQSQAFIRLRIGIQPQRKTVKEESREHFVLSKFSPAEVSLLDKVIPQAAAAVSLIINQGLSSAMNQINQQNDS